MALKLYRPKLLAASAAIMLLTLPAAAPAAQPSNLDEPLEVPPPLGLIGELPKGPNKAQIEGRAAVSACARKTNFTFPRGFDNLSSNDQLMAYLEATRPAACIQIAERELWDPVGTNCMVRDGDDPIFRRPANVPLAKWVGTPKLIEACVANLTVDDILAGSDQARWKAAAFAEQVASAKKQAADEAKVVAAAQAQKAKEANDEAARLKVRNFDIKGLTIATTREQFNALGGNVRPLECKTDVSIKTEACLAKLAVLSCEQVPVAYGSRTLYVPKCTYSYYATVAPALKQIETLAGVKVIDVSGVFFEGRLAQLSVNLGESTRVHVAALTEKYGQPNRVDVNGDATWFGKDEELIANNKGVTLVKNSLVAAQKNVVTAAQEAAKGKAADAARNEKAKVMKDI